MLAPYLLFIQRNGGVAAYFQQASAWAERDRDRAPVVWPGLFDNPDGVADETKAATGVSRVLSASLRDNMVAWLAYTEIALPFFALFVLWMSSDGGRPGWQHARAKLAMVAILAIMLDAFLPAQSARRPGSPIPQCRSPSCVSWLRRGRAATALQPQVPVARRPGPPGLVRGPVLTGRRRHRVRPRGRH